MTSRLIIAALLLAGCAPSPEQSDEETPWWNCVNVETTEQGVVQTNILGQTTSYNTPWQVWLNTGNGFGTYINPYNVHEWRCKPSETVS